MTAVKMLGLLLAGASALAAVAGDLPPLNNPATTDWYPGKFVWGDLITSDQGAAERFYTGLFHWTSNSIERTTSSGTHTYIVLANSGRPIGGIALRPSQLKDDGRGRWIGYVSVPDVKQAIAFATAGNGRVIFPLKNLPERGTQAIVADPEGAMLGLLRSSSGDPGEYEPAPGDWSWAELFARDPDAECLFYHSIAGFDVLPDTRTNRLDRFVFSSGGYARASIAPLPDRPGVTPGWLLFVRVAGLNDVVSRVASLGGRVLASPKAIGKNMRIAVIADPTDAAIGVVEISSAPAL